MLFKGTSARIPGRNPHSHAGCSAPAILGGSKLARCAVLLLFGTVALAYHGESHGAEVTAACDAKAYKKCPNFSVSLTKGNISEVGGNFMGYVRSKGDWTINVRYEPRESCAKISLLVDMGPLDFYRDYKRVFTGGAGTISDSGTFVHETGNIDSALGIDSSSCRMPKEDESSKRTQQQQQEFDESLDARQDDGGETEGGLGSEFEQQLLAMEQQTARWEQEELERRRLEQQEQASRDSESLIHTFVKDINKDLARLKRQVEDEQRAKRQRQQAQRQQQQASGSGLDTFLQGMVMGANVFNSIKGGGRRFATTPSWSSGGGTGSSKCERAQHRIARQLESQSYQTGRGQCLDVKSYLRMLQTAKSGLANAGCSRAEVNQFDPQIRWSKQTLNKVCN